MLGMLCVGLKWCKMFNKIGKQSTTLWVGVRTVSGSISYSALTTFPKIWDKMWTRLCIITQPVIANVNNTEKNRIFLYSRKFFFRLQLDLCIA